MAVQRASDAPPLEMLLQPATPPRGAHVTYGYRHNKRGEWTLTDYGRTSAAIAQRVLLRYSLGYETRSELAARYSLSAREIQAIISGERTHWFTDPVRERLIVNGVGNARMNRSDARSAEVRAALERLAAQAHAHLTWSPDCVREYRELLRTDLYLLSGAWREDEA